MNTIDALAGGNLLKWNEVMAEPFERVFTKMMMNKVNKEYQDRYREVLKSKQPTS